MLRYQNTFSLLHFWKSRPLEWVLTHRNDIEMEEKLAERAEGNINSRIFIQKASAVNIIELGTNITILGTPLLRYTSFLWLHHIVGSTDLSMAFCWRWNYRLFVFGIICLKKWNIIILCFSAETARYRI